MSDTTIFDQLNTEFSSKGFSYEELVSFEVEEFVWGPTVSLIKRKTPAADDTLSFKVVKPIAVVTLMKRDAA
jgi:hypothetical protein